MNKESRVFPLTAELCELRARGIESLSEDPPEACDNLVRVRWVMAGLTPHDPSHYGQRNQLVVCGITGLDCLYGMDLRVSRAFTEDAQNELDYLSENGKPEEEVRVLVNVTPCSRLGAAVCELYSAFHVLSVKQLPAFVD